MPSLSDWQVFSCAKTQEKQIAYKIKNMLRLWFGYAVANVAAKVAWDTPDQLENDVMLLKNMKIYGERIQTTAKKNG